MVKVKMRVDDDRDVLGPRVGYFKERVGKRLLPVDAIHLGLFVAPFFTYTGFDQYSLIGRLDKQAIHVQTDTIEFVGRANPFPKNTRDDAKHRPSVQSEFRIGNYLDAVIT